MNEEDLLKQIRSGDRQGFRHFVEIFRDRVYNTSLGLLQHKENAEDVTQEVFLEVFRSVGKFKGEAALSTWVYRITVQKSLEHIRNGNRKKRSGILLSLFGKEDRMNLSAETAFYHPGVRLENKERSAILFQAIAKLPLSQRTAFTLHKVEGLSHAEIAEVMKTTVSSVESLMVRAKENLKASLSSYYKNNET
jgi:RNA polymerase sigma factor (sigma-70 family)